ncbi:MULTISPECIES: hypothetical protein [Streptomyces]|uniref:Secreted protein n=1 Tax=Streptomyces lichenis TaxID=2306967 RepID=A0ABT0I471_9ACTN|nr:hypothetical protein [Streptomyces lichenis]MCK8676115.1 hypothetical protein [Streptomyces lichenis]
MRTSTFSAGLLAAVAAASLFAAPSAHAAGEVNTFTLSYGAATLTGTNTWSNRTVTTEGVNYVPQGAGSCRRVIARAYDANSTTLAEASSSWKCSAGKHPYGTELATQVPGGPAFVGFAWQQKPSATSPDTQATYLGEVFCTRNSGCS